MTATMTARALGTMSLAASSNGSGAAWGLLYIVYVAAYFTPSIVAISRRGAASTGSVIIVNFFLGWTVIGWIVALAMACRSRQRPVVVQMPPYYGPPQPGGGQYPMPGPPPQPGPRPTEPGAR